MEYKPIISPKMRAVANLLTESFVGMNHCKRMCDSSLRTRYPYLTEMSDAPKSVSISAMVWM